jgi:type I restriction enzyme S subunit
MVLAGVNGPVSHSGFTIRARLTSDEVTPEWVGQYFAIGLAKRAIMRRGGGTNISNLSQQILQDLPIPVPETHYRQQVLRVAQGYTDSLKLLDADLRAKRDFKRGLMQQLLTGRKRFPEFGEPATCDGPPDDWSARKLSDVVEIRVSNVDKHVNDGEQRVPLCNYMDVWRNDHITAHLPFMNGAATEAEVRKFGLQVGDVLLTKDSETPEEIAKAAVVDSVVPGLTLGYHVALLRPDGNHAVGDFLAAQLSISTFRKHFVRNAAGATRFGLSIRALETAEVWLPSLPEQRRIAALNRLLQSEIELLQRQEGLLRVERRALLSKLLRGELPIRS